MEQWINQKYKMPHLIINSALLLISITGYISCWFYYIRVANAKVPQTPLPLLGAIIPPLGVLVGLYYLLLGPTKGRVIYQQKEFFTNATDAEIVNHIDQNSNSSLIATNSAWYKERWHKLNHDEKLKWVNSRRNRITNSLSNCENAPSFVNALSKIDY